MAFFISLAFWFQDISLENFQERMDFLRSRINDVNLNMKSLMETSESVSTSFLQIVLKLNRTLTFTHSATPFP